MKTKNKKKQKPESITITILRTDKEYLKRIKKEMRLVSILAVVERIINKMKELNLKEELKWKYFGEME